MLSTTKYFRTAIILCVIASGLHYLINSKSYSFSAREIKKISEKYAGQHPSTSFQKLLIDLRHLYAKRTIPSIDPNWFTFGGNFQAKIYLIHVSLTEYLALIGSLGPTSGHVGIYWMNQSCSLLVGSVQRWKDDSYFTRETFKPGDHIRFGMFEGSVIEMSDDTWVLCYGRAAKLSYRATAAVKPLAGSVRNLVFRTLPYGITAPLLLDTSSVRQSDDNQCGPWANCANGASCYSTDDGPKCDCGLDFEGEKCQFEKDPLEATLSGSEYFYYDFSPNWNSLLSSEEQLSLYFKTKQPSAMLFYSGDNQDYVHLALKDGTVVASSNFAGEFHKAVVKKSVTEHTEDNDRFNDDRWHSVVLRRKIKREQKDGKLCMVLSLNVDGKHSKIEQPMANFEMFISTVAYVAGKPHRKFFAQILEDSNFVGCLTKVRLFADGCSIDFLNQLKDSYGFVELFGKITFVCRDSTSSEPVSFRKPRSYLALPLAVPLSRSSTFSLKFKTNERDGILLYSQSGIGSDFIVIELVDGLAYLVLDLGSGVIRLQASTSPIKSRHWHSVTIVREFRSGRIIFDDETTEFSTPGTAMTLELNNPLYIGGVPKSLNITPSVWSRSLGKSFLGCLKEFSINSVTFSLTDYLSLNKSSYWNSKSLQMGCEEPPMQCVSNPCSKGAQCMDGWGSFFCDCSNTMKSGHRCERDVTVLRFEGDNFLLIPMEQQISEAEDIQLKFKAIQASCLLAASSYAHSFNSSNSFKIILVEGRLEYQISLLGETYAVRLGNGLNDNTWHTVKFRRRATKLELSLDREVPVVNEIGSRAAFIVYDSAYVGALPRYRPKFAGRHVLSKVSNTEHDTKPYDGFRGEMASFLLNGVDVFASFATKQGTKIQRYTAPGVDLSGSAFGGRSGDTSKDVESEYHRQKVHDYTENNSMMFTSRKSFARLKVDTLGPLLSKLSFTFRTLENSGVILYGLLNKGYFAVELFNSQLRFLLFTFGTTSIVETSPEKLLNDFLSHTLMVQRISASQYDVHVDGQVYPLFTDAQHDALTLTGFLYVGDIERANGTSHGSLPKAIQSEYGFRGCLSALTVNGRVKDLIGDAVVFDELRTGCEGPANLCQVHSCLNGGICIQQWNDHYCDCSLTTFTGRKCSETSISYKFGPAPAVLIYGPMDQMQIKGPDVRLAFGLVTSVSRCVIMHVESLTSVDFLSVQLEDGYVVIQYDVGSGINYLGDFVHRVNDRKYHRLKTIRIGNNSTLQIDDYEMVMKAFQNKASSESSSDPQRIHIVGRLNSFESFERVRRNSMWNKVLDPFSGLLTGISYNDLRVLDKAAEKDPLIKSYGDVTFYSSKNSIFFLSNEVDESFPLDEVGYTIETSDDRSTEFITPSDEFGTTECGSMDDEDKCMTDEDQRTTEFITPVFRRTTDRTTTTRVLPNTGSHSPTTVKWIFESPQTPSTTFPTQTASHSHHASTRVSSGSPPLPRPTVPYMVAFGPTPTTPSSALFATDGNVGDKRSFSRTGVITGVCLILLILLVVVIITVYMCRARRPDEYSAIGDEAGVAKASVSTNVREVESSTANELRTTSSPGPADTAVKVNGQPEAGKCRKDVKEWYV